MKKIYIIISAILFLYSMDSCKKYEPLYGVPGDNDQPLNLAAGLIKDMVYIHNNDVYLTDEVLYTHKKLTSSPTSPKTHCVIASTHDRIAYLDSSGTPVIIDTSGVEIAHLTQYTNVKSMDWHSGSQTLYMLINNQVYFYGQSLNLPTPLFSVFPANAVLEEIDFIKIDEDLNVAYSYRYQEAPYVGSSSLNYYYGVAINYMDAFKTDINAQELESNYIPSLVNYSTLEYKYYYQINFCERNNGYNFIFLNKISNGKENDPTFFSDYQWTYPTSNLILNSSYRALDQSSFQEHKIGYLEINQYSIFKRLDDLPNNWKIYSSNYLRYSFDSPNASFPVYMDWK